jgi:hypothetical protein
VKPLADKATRGVLLEPRDALDKAIVRLKRGLPVYSYWLCIGALMEYYEWTQDDAMDWVDFNILSIEDPEFFELDYRRRNLPEHP